jgi:1,2-diacylglycerol 3-alpha-glucosyltransferase
MKIGLFTDSYLPLHDGVATSVANLARELKEMGHDVFVIAPKRYKYRDRKNVIRLFAVRLFDQPEFWAGVEIPHPSLFKVFFMKFDIIHGHSGGPISFMGWQMAKLKGIPFVMTYHTFWKHYRHYFILPRLLSPKILEKISAITANMSDSVVVPTEKVRVELVSYGAKKPIHVIPSGIYTENFNYAKRGFLHEKLNIPASKKILLTVGRLGKEKSLGMLLQAFAMAAKINPQLVLVIVGQGRKKDKDNLNTLIQKLALDHKVFNISGVDHADMPKVYADAKLFLFASFTETQGLVVIEALASGVPVVAVKSLTFDGVIKEGYNGYQTERSIDDFAKRIIKVMENDDTLEKLASNARESAEIFSVHHTADEISKLYMKLIQQKNSSHSPYKQEHWTPIVKK